MRLGLFMALCLVAHSVCAANIDVSQRGAFLVLKQEAGGSLVLHSAIKRSHISSVTLDRQGKTYKITIITLQSFDSGGAAQNYYELNSDDRQALEEAFCEILELLAQEESEVRIPAKTMRR